MKLKLSELQRFRLRTAHNESSAVLREIKSLEVCLKGEALSDMKSLESAVQTLEVILIGK